MSFALQGHRFGASDGWRELEEERYSIYRKADGGSRRHGAAKFRRRVRAYGYVQDGGAVWRRGGINGKPDKVDVSVTALEMDQGKMVVTTYESAPDRCVTQFRCVAGLGHPDLDVRLWCDVCLVFGSDIRQPFLKGIGVATGIAKMAEIGRAHV